MNPQHHPNLHRLLRIPVGPFKLTMLTEGSGDPRASSSPHPPPIVWPSHIHSVTTWGLCCPSITSSSVADLSVFCVPLLGHKLHAVEPLPGSHLGPCLAYSGYMRNICGTHVCCFCLFKIADLFADTQSLLLGKVYILGVLRFVPGAMSLSPSQNLGCVMMRRPASRLGGGSG